MKLQTLIADIRNGKKIIENDIKEAGIADVIDYIFMDNLIDHNPKFVEPFPTDVSLCKSSNDDKGKEVVKASKLLFLIGKEQYDNDRKAMLTTYRKIEATGIELYDKELLPEQIEGRGSSGTVYIIDENNEPNVAYYDFFKKKWLSLNDVFADDDNLNFDFKWFYVPDFISFD